MNATDLAKNFASFLGKHSTELRVVSATLQTVVDHLPIDQGTKNNLTEGLNALQTSAGRIAAAAGDLAGEPIEVVVSKADVDNAVAAYIEAHRTTLFEGAE
jgi:hypothetical protein